MSIQACARCGDTDLHPSGQAWKNHGCVECTRCSWTGWPLEFEAQAAWQEFRIQRQAALAQT